MKAYAGQVKIGNCPEANLSKSRNVGIALSTGDIVCFIDDDAVPEPDWLDKLETGYSDPNVAAVGGYIRNHTGVEFQCKVTVCDRFGDGHGFESIEAANPDAGPNSKRYLALTGTNSSFRRHALLEIGGFDEEYAYFLDETDVIVRLIDRGYKVEYVPDAEIHHKYAASHLRTTSKLPKTIYLPVRSKAYFCVQNALPGTPYTEIVSFLQRYASGLKKDKKWYLDNGMIDAPHYHRLISEIDKGIYDGVADAHSHPNRRVMTQKYWTDRAQEFHAFKPLLSAEKRLKICLLSQDYPPAQCGGIGVWTHELATGLARMGHEVSVVTRGHDHPTVDFEDGVWVHRIVPVWWPDRATPALPDIPPVIRDYAYTAFDEVQRIHARRGLDVVSSPIWDLEGIACIADGSIPTILSLHTTFKLALPFKPEWTSNQEYKTHHVDKIIRGEEWVLNHAKHILANSHAVIQDIEREYGMKISRSHTSIVPHGIEDYSEKESLPSKNNGEQKLLFVGRFERRKGIDLLLEVIPTLLRKYKNLKVDLVGENNLPAADQATYKDLFVAAHKGQADILDRVNFVGTVSKAELLNAYQNCDIFAAPSRYESFGLILIEAMRFGKAVVGARIGGMQEVVSDGVDGLLFKSEDAADLRQKLDQILGDPDLRNRLGRAARESFETKFSTEVMCDAVAKVYAQLHPTESAEDVLGKTPVEVKRKAA
ncbi:glycosyltransferase Family 4 family protein [Ralstonia insidiosa]|uniref:Glycosyltransferase Family 4 family protein n=1 Tax=Ralstonia insidiosa TaxID=190721 RepID=A0AAC9FS62_9RALS|nr:glycosyltransferase Family 4 family protein [Ralstonia insidiosa]